MHNLKALMTESTSCVIHSDSTGQELIMQFYEDDKHLNDQKGTKKNQGCGLEVHLQLHKGEVRSTVIKWH